MYDPDKKIQLRIRGKALLCHQNEIARKAWDKTSLSARRCYMGPAPGEKIDSPDTLYSNNLGHRLPTPQESEETGWPNFSVIEIEIQEIEHLHLKHTGHERCLFSWKERNLDPEITWIAP